jgi:hypothetical protein
MIFAMFVGEVIGLRKEGGIVNTITELPKRLTIKKIILATRRRWSWKVFLVLAALILPASFAILPYAIHLQNAFSETDTVSAMGILVINTLLNLLIISLANWLALANRIELDLSSGWARRNPLYRFRTITAIAWIAAVAFVLTILFLQRSLRLMNAMFELGI